VGVGKVVMRAAAEHLTPVLLKLGGPNPAIVDETTAENPSGGPERKNSPMQRPKARSKEIARA
jgi:hypothetical protein